MASNRSQLTDIEVEVHHITERAILVSTDGERETAVWLPLSVIEVETTAPGRATITLTQKLAEDKGLV